MRSTRPVDREDPNMRAPAPVPARLCVTGIHEEAMEPDLEAFRISETGQIPPGEQECLLDGVPRHLDIPKDPIGDGVAAAAVEADQLTEGDVVAPLRLFDQPHSHGWISHGTQTGCFGY
jgi:hypothetical protein